MIFFHTKIRDREALRDLIARIRAKSLEFGISPHFVIPVEKDEIPKMGIEKVQRSQLQKRFLEGGSVCVQRPWSCKFASQNRAIYSSFWIAWVWVRPRS